MENTNHPQTYCEFDSVPKPYMPIMPHPDYGDGFGDTLAAFHNLTEQPGVSDCPWLTWEECISDALRQLLGCRLQELCNNRRIRGDIVG